MLCKLGEHVGRGVIFPYLAKMGVVADVFTEDHFPVWVDGDVIEHLLAFATIKQHPDCPALSWIRGIVEVDGPQSAGVIECVRGDEIETIRILRIPRSVFRPQERGNTG